MRRGLQSLVRILLMSSGDPGGRRKYISLLMRYVLRAEGMYGKQGSRYSSTENVFHVQMKGFLDR